MEKPFKIAFIGTCCTGKTTLLDHYKERYKKQPEVVYVEEVARDFFSKNQVAHPFTVETQSQIQHLVLKSERMAHKCSPELIICDRSVIDSAVYLRAKGDIKGSHILFYRVRFWIPSYQHLLLLNPEGIPYKTDAIRRETSEERQLFHNTFLDFFSETEIPYEIISGTLEERIKKVDRIIDCLRHP